MASCFTSVLPVPSVLSTTPRQVIWQQNRIEAWVGLIARYQMAGVGIRKARYRIAARIQARRVQCRIDHPERVVLTQKRLFVHRADLHIVDALGIRNIGAHARIGQRAELLHRLLLNRSQVGQRIVAGIVVEPVLAYEHGKVQDAVVIDRPRVSRRNVDRSRSSIADPSAPPDYPYCVSNEFGV